MKQQVTLRITLISNNPFAVKSPKGYYNYNLIGVRIACQEMFFLTERHSLITTTTKNKKQNQSCCLTVSPYFIYVSSLDIKRPGYILCTWFHWCSYTLSRTRLAIATPRLHLCTYIDITDCNNDFSLPVILTQLINYLPIILLITHLHKWSPK